MGISEELTVGCDIAGINDEPIVGSKVVAATDAIEACGG